MPVNIDEVRRRYADTLQTCPCGARWPSDVYDVHRQCPSCGGYETQNLTHDPDIMALCDEVGDLRAGVAAGRRAAKSAKDLAATLMEVGRVLGAEPYSSPLEPARVAVAEVERARALVGHMRRMLAEVEAERADHGSAGHFDISNALEDVEDGLRAALARYEEAP